MPKQPDKLQEEVVRRQGLKRKFKTVGKKSLAEKRGKQQETSGSMTIDQLLVEDLLTIRPLRPKRGRPPKKPLQADQVHQAVQNTGSGDDQGNPISPPVACQQGQAQWVIPLHSHDLLPMDRDHGFSAPNNGDSGDGSGLDMSLHNRHGGGFCVDLTDGRAQVVGKKRTNLEKRQEAGRLENESRRCRRRRDVASVAASQDSEEAAVVSWFRNIFQPFYNLKSGDHQDKEASKFSGSMFKPP